MKDKVLAIIAVRDEERFLPGYFSHLRDFVHGFVIVDDASRDRTPRIIAAEPKVVFAFRRENRAEEHFYEVENREVLLQAARDLGAEWVIAGDADERFEKRFLENFGALRREADEQSRSAVSLQLFALWNSPRTYRVTSGERLPKFAFFRVPADVSYADRPRRALHSSWLPAALTPGALHWATDYRLYHLRSVRSDDRQKRYEKFRRIDPQNFWQSVGYEHLISGKGLALREIEPGREFDPASLPEDLKE